MLCSPSQQRHGPHPHLALSDPCCCLFHACYDVCPASQELWEGCGGRGPTGAELSGCCLLGLTTRSSSHLPGDPCPRCSLLSAPQTGQHPPWMGFGWGVPAATQSLSQTAGQVSHQGAQEKLGLWANPASENHGPSFQSLLLTAAALGMAVGWTTAVQCGPPHGTPGGPDTWGSRNLAATMHSEQPRASLSVRHQKEAAPSRGGWPTEHIAHCAYCEFQRLTLSLHKL